MTFCKTIPKKFIYALALEQNNDKYNKYARACSWVFIQGSRDLKLGSSECLIELQ
jgi:hypothetical protein